MENKSIPEKIVNIFLGASWAIITIFTIIAFKIYENHTIFVSLSAGFIGFIIGLSLILFFETILLQFKKFRESEKQTKLLEEINKKLSQTQAIA